MTSIPSSPHVPLTHSSCLSLRLPSLSFLPHHVILLLSTQLPRDTDILPFASPGNRHCPSHPPPPFRMGHPQISSAQSAPRCCVPATEEKNIVVFDGTCRLVAVFPFIWLFSPCKQGMLLTVDVRSSLLFISCFFFSSVCVSYCFVLSYSSVYFLVFQLSQLTYNVDGIKVYLEIPHMKAEVSFPGII